jgi:hypothetical protein
MRAAPPYPYGHPDICKRWHLDLVTDATANDAPNQAGYIIFLNHSPIAYRSFMQRRVLLSSATSEGYAMVQGLDTLSCMRQLLTFVTNEPAQISCAAHTDAMDACHVLLSSSVQSTEEGRRVLDSVMRSKIAGQLPCRHASPLPPEAPHVLLAPSTPTTATTHDVYDPMPYCSGDSDHAPHFGYWFSKRLDSNKAACRREVAKADRINKVLIDAVQQDRIWLYHIPTKYNVADQLTKPTDLKLLRTATMCRVPRFDNAPTTPTT